MAALPSWIDMLTELVSHRSISSANPDLDTSNEAVIDALATWAESLGFRCQKLPVSPGKFNLLATLGEGAGGLVLSGHTDTVPFDADGWDSDPFVLTRRDNRLHGLGSTDMKGFLALALTAVSDLNPKRLREPLILLGTADEESSMDGARALAQAGYPRARFAVIGEPTGLVPVRAHKGILMERIQINGQSAHSSNPDLGVSALDAMHRVIGELHDYRNELKANQIDPGFSVPWPTLNLGCIHGGDAPNRVCSDCALDFDLRPTPGLDPDQLRAQIDARLSQVAEQTGADIRRTPLFEAVPPFGNPGGALLDHCAELTGHAPITVGFGTEAPFLAALDMEVVVMGPGSIDVAHQPNEYLPIDQAQQSMGIIKQLIQKHCL